FKPLNLDVLPLYIVLMAAFPIVLWFMMRWRNAVMIGSIGLYLAARHYSWNFASYPAGVWYFNPFAWQLVFVFGAWLALGGAAASRAILQNRILYVLSTAFVLMKLSFQAARSIGWSMGFVARVCQPSTLRMLICPEASSAQNIIAAVSAEGSTVWVLIRRLNSSCNRSIAFVV
ncbi:hypothetical protein KXV85_003664, partial [Aspergillus fumigatus]